MGSYFIRSFSVSDTLKIGNFASEKKVPVSSFSAPKLPLITSPRPSASSRPRFPRVPQGTRQLGAPQIPCNSGAALFAPVANFRGA